MAVRLRIAGLNRLGSRHLLCPQEICIEKAPGEKLGISIRGGAKGHAGNPFDPTDEGIFISKVLNCPPCVCLPPRKHACACLPPPPRASTWWGHRNMPSPMPLARVPAHVLPFLPLQCTLRLPTPARPSSHACFPHEQPPVPPTGKDTHTHALGLPPPASPRSPPQQRISCVSVSACSCP